MHRFYLHRKNNELWQKQDSGLCVSWKPKYGSHVFLGSISRSKITAHGNTLKTGLVWWLYLKPGYDSQPHRVDALEFRNLGEANSTLSNSEGIEESARMWDMKLRMRNGPITGNRDLCHVAWAAFSLLVGRWTQEFKWHSEALLMRWRLLMRLRRYFQFTSEMVQSCTGELICHRARACSPFLWSIVTHARLSYSPAFLGCPAAQSNILLMHQFLQQCTSCLALTCEWFYLIKVTVYFLIFPLIWLFNTERTT